MVTTYQAYDIPHVVIVLTTYHSTWLCTTSLADIIADNMLESVANRARYPCMPYCDKAVTYTLKFCERQLSRRAL